eukprot:4893643-Prymnesium_polylepis.2
MKVGGRPHASALCERQRKRSLNRGRPCVVCVGDITPQTRREIPLSLLGWNSPLGAPTIYEGGFLKPRRPAPRGLYHAALLQRADRVVTVTFFVCKDVQLALSSHVMARGRSSATQYTQ